jgi:D-alanyl-D-alanine carboxypeptidase/D-alanyl-D-alanine-endopeptidase (penicillin-binding protein 4)
MKLVTTAAAIEMLGPDYTFKSVVGYIGKISNGTLKGDIIIKGGGDPCLGSGYFKEHYGDIITDWSKQIIAAGIRKVKGRVITDDSFYDYHPVPPDWNWEDMGNYYGAGVYGLSIFDNTLNLHFKTAADGTRPLLTGIEPEGSGMSFVNRLTASGSSDQGYFYSAPYAPSGWIEGTIPAGRDDFVLKASVSDPPLMAATMLTTELEKAGVPVTGKPATKRVLPEADTEISEKITDTYSPALSEIIKVLNQESVNLYAEHLVRELGRVFRGEGSNAMGIDVIMNFLDSTGIGTEGMFILDGSGLAPQDALSSGGLTSLLVYMKLHGRHAGHFINSLPEAGKNGTLKSYFRDPLFDGNLRAKSGTLSRVKSYAGYFTTLSGKEMAFTIIVNNFTAPSRYIITSIENILKECIQNY